MVFINSQLHSAYLQYFVKTLNLSDNLNTFEEEEKKIMLEDERNQTKQWTQKEVIALIEAYKKRPVLWNTHPRQCPKMREEAMLDLAKELQRSTKQCKKKWESIGSSFRKERILIRKGNISNWWAFSHMRFLLKRGQCYNEEPKRNKITKVSDNEEDSNHELQDPKLEIEEETVTGLNNDYVKSEDEDAIFGELVTKKLRQYDDYTKTAIQSAILKVFLDANNGMLGNVQLNPH